MQRHCENEDASLPVPVHQRATRKRPPKSTDGRAADKPKRQRCVPLRDLNEQWETESNSSIAVMLC